ncbi:MAG: transcriptional repressor [Bacteroidaceae bacterium]|nr:transcriptional repressor [Bacteroidaceae bacterium]
MEKNNNAQGPTHLHHREGLGGGSAIASFLEARGVKPTSTRLLVYRALAEHHHPMSLRELDDALDTVDRSSIFRTLTLLLAHHLVHVIEGGAGTALYEVCEGHDHCSLSDQHAHFYCTSCQRTFCFHSLHVPQPEMPAGFTATAINYLVKGLCPDCAASPVK